MEFKNNRLHELLRMADALLESKKIEWSAEKLADAFERTLSGSPDDRVSAILAWSSGVFDSNLPISEHGPKTALEAFDYLKTTFENEASGKLKDAALRGIGLIFRRSSEEEVTQFLASVVVSTKYSQSDRICAYRQLWTVTDARLGRPIVITDSKRSVSKSAPGDVASAVKFVTDLKHFVFETSRPDFSLEQIRFDWVEKFIKR